MARKKCNCPPEGAPEWMVTFGDMMSLLLCFFVLIVSFSEIKTQHFKAVIQQIQQAWGMSGGGGRLPTDQDPATSLINMLQTTRLGHEKVVARSNAQDPGMDGKEARVTRIREGKLYGVGGRLSFKPGSARLSESDKARLRQVADLVRGYNNLIEVRGNASPNELSHLPESHAAPAASNVAFAFPAQAPGSPGPAAGPAQRSAPSPAPGGAREYDNLWDLSYARAKAVMDYMTSKKVGLNPARFRLIGNGDQEPIAHRAYDTAGQAPNRRVEVQVSDKVMREVTRPELNAP